MRPWMAPTEDMASADAASAGLPREPAPALDSAIIAPVTHHAADPVDDASQVAAPSNILLAHGGMMHSSVRTHGGSSHINNGSRLIASPSGSRGAVQDLAGQRGASGEDESDLAEAIAMSLGVPSNSFGTHASAAIDSAGNAPDPDLSLEVQSVRVSSHAQAGVDTIRRCAGRASVSQHAPICGDCSPPPSWQLRFCSGRCSTCNARVDVLFWPGVS